MFLISVSTIMGTPQRNDNLNFDNSETSSVASDSSNIVVQATSKTNKDLKYTQQDFERIKADIESQYKIQVAIEIKNFEKEIQNYYYNHLKTIKNELVEMSPRSSMLQSKLMKTLISQWNFDRSAPNLQNRAHFYKQVEMSPSSAML